MNKLSRLEAKATFRKRVVKTECTQHRALQVTYARVNRTFAPSLLFRHRPTLPNSSSFSTPSIMTTEQQTSTTVSLTTATTQAPVTTAPSNTSVSGSAMSLGIDTMPSNSLTDTQIGRAHV